jgi:hypothetical protein
MQHCNGAVQDTRSAPPQTPMALHGSSNAGKRTAPGWGTSPTPLPLGLARHASPTLIIHRKRGKRRRVLGGGHPGAALHTGPGALGECQTRGLILRAQRQRDVRGAAGAEGSALGSKGGLVPNGLGYWSAEGPSARLGSPHPARPARWANRPRRSVNGLGAPICSATLAEASEKSTFLLSRDPAHALGPTRPPWGKAPAPRLGHGVHPSRGP